MFKTLKNKIQKKIDETDNLNDCLKYICDLLKNNLNGYDWVGFYFHVEKKHHLELLVFSGIPTEHTKIPFGKGICGQTAISNSSYLTGDVSKEENYISCNINVKSEIVVPILNSDNINIGQIDIDSNNLNQFSNDDLRFLESINKMISKRFF